MSDWFDARGDGSRCDVRALLDSKGGDAIRECIELGALVGLGLTSDGGALGVTITVDGKWRREWFRDSEQLADWMAEAVPAVRLAVEAVVASSGRGNGQRGRRTR